MKKIAIVGAGKVGVALGFLLEKAEQDLIGSFSRSKRSMELASKFLSCPVFSSVHDAVRDAGIVIFTVQDREIAAAAEQLASEGLIMAGMTVLHTSGSHGLSVLMPAKLVGAAIGSLHPIQTFPTVESAIEHLPGSWFGVTSELPAMTDVKEIISILKGRIIEIPDEQRPLYHTGSVAACNFIVACMDLAIRVFMKFGVSETQAYDILKPLTLATFENIGSKGIEAALTGPVERGDIATIAAHLAALAVESKTDLEFYKAATAQIGGIAARKGSITKEQLNGLAVLLEGDKYD